MAFESLIFFILIRWSFIVFRQLPSSKPGFTTGQLLFSKGKEKRLTETEPSVTDVALDDL